MGNCFVSARTRRTYARALTSQCFLRKQSIRGEVRLSRAPGQPAARRILWPEALQRDACVDDRSRGLALSQVTGQGGEALLHGTCVDGEPQRPRRRRLFDRSQRPRRADRAAAHDRPRADRPTTITLGTDLAYDSEEFVNELRSINGKPPAAAACTRVACRDSARSVARG
jgi:hypothetical protein